MISQELVKQSFDFLLTSMIFDLMKHIGWRERLFKSTRGRILELLRTRECTVNDLAEELRLTDNAVRAHLASLERDRLVVQSGMKPGFRKPHATYALGPEAEQLVSEGIRATGLAFDVDILTADQTHEICAPECGPRVEAVAMNICASCVGKTREAKN